MFIWIEFSHCLPTEPRKLILFHISCSYVKHFADWMRFIFACSYLHLLTYPLCYTFPWFLQVGIFMAVFNASFHLVYSCTMFESILLKWRSSFIDSLHVLCDLPLPWQLTISTWVQWFIHSWLLFTFPCYLIVSKYYTGLYVLQFWP